MILHTRKFLDNHILVFLMMLQIILSQMSMSAGFTVPQSIAKGKSDISVETFQNYLQQDVDTTNRKLCIMEMVFGNSKSPNLQCDDLSSISISEIIKDAYHYSNGEMGNFDKILKFIEKQQTKDIKELAYNVLYQEVLDHYMLENLETTQMNVCLLEIILGKKQEAIGHFKDLEPSSVSQVIEYADNFQNGTHLTKFMKFIVKKPEISSIEHNIIITAMKLVFNKNMGHSTLIFGGIKLIEVGLKLHSTNIESNYFNKLEELWGDIIVSYCELANYKRVRFTKLKDLPSHLHQMEGKFEKMENYFLDILIPSVRRVLNKEGVESKLDMILKCVPKLIPFIEPGAIIYSTVFDEVTKQNLSNTNNFITKFAYYIKNYMELPNYSNIEEKYKEVFENLKRNIPDWAQELIWNGDSCKLKNRKWDQYLSTCGKFGCNTTSVDSHMVFSSQDTLQESTEVSQWKFETNNQGTSFTIKNVDSDEFLYSSSNNTGEKSRLVLTSRIPNNESLWNITASSDGSYIKLQNTHNKEYLSVGGPYGNDQIKRKVLIQSLESPTQKVVRESEWELIC
ncbi:uncharacterized protein LOC123297520 [Chrysoperla carnea]|uniref:uncharacterized protein LOC123297520 n=1 Tax=Chrysoperla carnea TaxID=189513 RepID=UPI001D09025A|nr:uncharacterized protein LOC123297520 [Chrysoperla carnea]